MLPKASRLDRSSFTSLERASYAHSAHFLLRYKLGGTSSRLGASASKKVSKSAVVRNRVRRRVYAAVVGSLPSLPGGIYLVSAKPGAEKLKGEVLKAEVAELLKKSYNH